MTFWRLPLALVFLASWLPGLVAADAAPAEPRQVTVGFKLLAIPAIQEPEETFTAICSLDLRWQDPALKAEDGKRVMLIGDAAHEKAAEIGAPAINFVNETTAAESKNVALVISPAGNVEYDQEFEVTLRGDFDLRSFPFDRQTLKIDLESFAFSAQEMALQPDPARMKLAPIALAQWRAGNLSWASSVSEDDLDRETHSRLTVTLPMIRKSGFYVWQVFVPLFILILIASTVFFLPAEDLSDRIGVIVTSLLTVVALSYTVRQDIPKVPYLTTIDRLFVTAYVFLCLEMAGMLLVRHLADRSAEAARKFDIVGRWIYPGAYLFANAVIILTSVVQGHSN